MVDLRLITGRNLARSTALSRIKFTGGNNYNGCTLCFLRYSRKLSRKTAWQLLSIFHNNIPIANEGGISNVGELNGNIFA
jgi:hypothetical protein